MRTMNKQINLPEIQKIMTEFERESEMMDLKDEMMNDAIDDVMEGDDDEEESDQIVNQILDEIGVDLKESVSLLTNLLEESHSTHSFMELQFVSAPTGNLAKESTTNEDVGQLLANDSDLQARLDNLRKA